MYIEFPGEQLGPNTQEAESGELCRQDLLPTCKRFPKKPPHAFGSHQIIRSAIVQCNSCAAVRTTWDVCRLTGT